ncbi:MAG TPA: ribonuclease PH [Synergistaceae bacterium]|jgi:ribonuclease PH|nr:MAG: Ribonuclease PH [Synergistales bacterium 54_9]MDN5336719.1 ribonuclease [Synergistales bacterium]HAA47265.1 ribonuclease PH [Synergistaceae bacterium]HAG22541.1 ribonuclease PH [Synergistaceae bacterium]
MKRHDGRTPEELRPVTIERGFTKYAEGSVRIGFGDTWLICTASVEEKVPSFLRGSGQGWITAEYSMLPRATEIRSPRDSVKGRISGRSHEIQRIVGRSLRAGVDLGKLGERTVWVDCDVIQADGGTRTAAITGGFVALVDALRKLYGGGHIDCIPVRSFIAALSVGKVEGVIMADLCYEEDAAAEVDFNIVMNDRGEFIELQGTGESGTFSRNELDRLLDIAGEGVGKLIKMQKDSLALTKEEEESLL